MSRPDFLVIGAMKAGTTSLASDLSSHPEVFVPEVKEPHFLTKDGVLDRGEGWYGRLFAEARAGQLRSDASTGYTKRPRISGVAERARRFLGTTVPLIYMVRHPVDRSLSHHYHLARAGDAPADPDRAIAEIPEIVDVSRYAFQLTPWLDLWPRERICVVRFEDYLEDRRATLERLFRHLGLATEDVRLPSSPLLNRGEAARVPRGVVRRLLRPSTGSVLYKTVIRSWLPGWARSLAQRALLRPARERPPAPSPATLRHLREVFAHDQGQLLDLLGPGCPRWDLEAAEPGPPEGGEP